MASSPKKAKKKEKKGVKEVALDSSSPAVQGLRLQRAFAKIRDAKIRRNIVELVESLAPKEQ